MALTSQAAPAAAPRPVTAWHFVRLKLRVLRNGLRGQSWRIALFVLGTIGGLWFAGTGFVLLALPALLDDRPLALVVAAFGGGLLVLGWMLLPLVLFGVDETLDPSRFALLPLRRWTLVTGLLAAALVGVPALATLVASAGLVVTAWRFGGAPAGLVGLIGTLAGLLLCVTASRAVTSAFSAMLRSRRMRDLAAILLAVCAALLGPLQLFIAGAAEQIDWDRLAGPARVVGWTPLGAAYTMGLDVAEGRAWAVPVKLLIVAGALALLLLWWSSSLESAMGGVAVRAGRRAAKRADARAAGHTGGHPAAGPGTPDTTGAVTEQFFPRAVGWLLPRDRYGALVAREVRYWWRDTRRRAGLITFSVISIFVPLMLNLGGRSEFGSDGFAASVVVASLSMLAVGVLAAVTVANQFGYDGSSYAANVVAGVPGRLELRSRIVAFSLYTVPLLVVAVLVLTLALGEPGWIGAVAGATFAGYGTSLATNLFASVLAPYALPESSNPFAMNSGAGLTKGLLSLVTMVAATAAASPVVIATALLGDIWLWLALPVGVGYGVAAAALGCYLAGDVLDHRMPELLAAVTPRR